MILAFIRGRSLIENRRLFLLSTCLLCAPRLKMAATSTSASAATRKTVQKNGDITGHHVYKCVRTRFIGKSLSVEQEEGNNYDKYTVSSLWFPQLQRDGKTPMRFLWGRHRSSFFTILCSFSFTLSGTRSTHGRTRHALTMPTFLVKARHLFQF